MAIISIAGRAESWEPTGRAAVIFGKEGTRVDEWVVHHEGRQIRYRIERTLEGSTMFYQERGRNAGAILAKDADAEKTWKQLTTEEA